MILLAEQSGAKLHWISAMTIYWLKIIGLAPFSYQFWKSAGNSRDTLLSGGFSYSKVGLAYNILLLILAQVQTAFGVQYLLSYADSTVSTQRMASVLPDVMYCVVPNLILISVTFHQKDAVSVMTRLVEVDRLLSGIEKQPQSAKSTYLAFSLHIISNSFIFPFGIFVIGSSRYRRLFYLIWKKLCFCIVYWFIVEYCIFVGLVVRQLERVNKNLSNFEVFSFSSSSPSPGGLCSLKLLLEIRTTLYEVSRDFTESFSLPILLAIGAIFYKSIRDTYFCVYIIVAGLDRDLGFYFKLLPNVYPVTLLAVNVTKAAKEAKLTRWIVHKLTAAATREGIRTELQDFGLQLLHEDTVYTAHGFFSLDCTMLLSMATAVTTYCVFCMQST